MCTNKVNLITSRFPAYFNALVYNACLLTALFNAVCLHNAYFLAFAFWFHALSWDICTYFVYFKYYFPSCTVLSISWFFYFYAHTVLLMKGIWAIWINIT